MKARPGFSLKDQLFNEEKVQYLSSLLVSADPDFPAQQFQLLVVEALPRLELKQRIAHIAECLDECLPYPFAENCAILTKALPPELSPEHSDDDFGDFIFSTFSHYVAEKGCNRRSLNRSLKTLREITKRFSAEYAIRPFLNRFPGETMAFLEDCTGDSHYHVRRLASEGTRPRLPWAGRLTIDHQSPVDILHRLHCDPTRYVTRSVANHVNDLSKIDPDLALDLLHEWRKSSVQKRDELNYIVRHSLRTLTRQGDRKALKMLGFPASPAIEITRFEVSPATIPIGREISLSLDFCALRSQKLLIDYRVISPGGNSKVFRWKQITTEKDQFYQLAKQHLFRLMTTRSLTPGQHRVELRINGNTVNDAVFQLSER